jgi:hypothetical protein
MRSAAQEPGTVNHVGLPLYQRFQERTALIRMGRLHWIAILNLLPGGCSYSRTTRPVPPNRRVLSILRTLMMNSISQSRGIDCGRSSRIPPLLTFSVKASISCIESLLPNFTGTGQCKGKRGCARRSGVRADALIAKSPIFAALVGNIEWQRLAKVLIVSSSRGRSGSLILLRG